MPTSQLRVLAARFCAGCFYYSGLVALARWRMQRGGQRVVILNYHRALDSDLRSHLVYLQRHYRLLPLEQALTELYAPPQDVAAAKDRRTALVVTFDDGYRDNYTDAAALACELHTPLTIFLIPGYVESDTRFWWYEGKHLADHAQVGELELDGRPYHLDHAEERQALAAVIYAHAYHAASVREREAFLTSMHHSLVVPSSPVADDDPLRPLRWAEVRDMEASGWISFGAHTMHHPVLGHLHDPVEVWSEVTESRTEMEHHLGHPVQTFAYPFGCLEHIGEYGSRAVQEAGFAWAVTTLRGINTPETSPYLLRRLSIGTNRHWLVLAADVAGVWPPRMLVRRVASRIICIGRPLWQSYQSRGGVRRQQGVGPLSRVPDDRNPHSARGDAGAEQMHGSEAEPPHAEAEGAEDFVALVHNLLKDSGIYAVAAIASPLVSLVLAPLLTHKLSRSDYGALAILTSIIALLAGITQMGLGSAFFRAYNYDYRTERDRLDVLSTIVILLAVVTIPTTLAALLLAPVLASVLLGSIAYSSAVRLAALVVLIQNLSVPGFAWLRAERRAAAYSVLSVLNVATVLAVTIALVGVLHQGLLGALMATAAGYASVVAKTLPLAVRKAGLHLRVDIVRNVLSFGVPMLAFVITVWVLQLSDRYLLGHFGSLTQTASYDVAYKLGGVVSPVILSPFQLAWPTALFAIARRKDARLIFQQVFRWYSSFLLFATYALSLTGMALLHWLFPPAYQSASVIIPIIALSLMFFGLSQMVGVGIAVKRKTWLEAVYVGLSAIVNVGLNVVAIPRYGVMAAAVSTLVAYVVLFASDYVVNQRIYPVQFEIGRSSIALLVGAAIFGVCTGFMELRPGIWGWAVQGAGLLVYGVWLFLWTTRHHALRTHRLQSLSADGVGRVKQLAEDWMRTPTTRARAQVGPAASAPLHICMHVLGTARLDARVLREARTLAQNGLAVSIVDVDGRSNGPREEDLGGVVARHIVMPTWFRQTRFKLWFLTKAIRMLMRGTLELWRTPADLYHAHDYDALLPCFIVARLRKKPLIFDAHELPLADPNVTRWRLLCAMYSRLLGLIVPQCAGVITVSPLIAHELVHRYRGPTPIVVRNIPWYLSSSRNDRLRQLLKLNSDARIALYQGNLQGDRGLDTLIRAATFLDPKIVIVLMGRGPLQPMLEKLIAHEGVGNTVKIIPPVAYDELLNWTASADLGLVVNPARFSRNVEMCLPNKLFEYLMAGVPVLSSRLAAVEAILVRYDVGRTIEPLQPDALGHAISAMLADRPGLEQMRRNALVATQQELNWEVEQQWLIDLYHRILNGSPTEQVGGSVPYVISG